MPKEVVKKDTCPVCGGTMTPLKGYPEYLVCKDCGYRIYVGK